MMWLKKLRRIVPMFFGILCLGSLAACEEDVSNHPRFKHFIGKRYEVIQPIFLVKLQNDLVIIPPGWDANTPISVQSYIDNPNNWWKTREYLDVHGHIALLDQMYIIVGIIPAHTILRVKHIRCTTGGLLGDSISVLGMIEDTNFNKREVFFCATMRNLFGSQACPVPRTEFIRELDASQQL